MAEIDGNVCIEEFKVLQEGVNASCKEELKEMLCKADQLDIWECISTVRSFDKEKKNYVLENLTKVLNADGVIEKSEEKLLDLLKVICEL